MNLGDGRAFLDGTAPTPPRPSPASLPTPGSDAASASRRGSEGRDVPHPFARYLSPGSTTAHAELRHSWSTPVSTIAFAHRVAKPSMSVVQRPDLRVDDDHPVVEVGVVPLQAFLELGELLGEIVDGEFEQRPVEIALPFAERSRSGIPSVDAVRRGRGGAGPLAARVALHAAPAVVARRPPADDVQRCPRRAAGRRSGSRRDSRRARRRARTRCRGPEPWLPLPCLAGGMPLDASGGSGQRCGSRVVGGGGPEPPRVQWRLGSLVLGSV